MSDRGSIRSAQVRGPRVTGDGGEVPVVLGRVLQGPETSHGEPETARRRKLVSGDVVAVDGIGVYRVVRI